MAAAGRTVVGMTQPGPDEQNRVADERDEAADERQTRADAREERLTTWEAELAERTRRLKVTSSYHIDQSRSSIEYAWQALHRSEARIARATAALDASARVVEREQATVDREVTQSARLLDTQADGHRQRP